MADALVQLAEGFWSIRGRFTIMGFLDIGTQCGIARLENGDWVLLDSYTMDERMLAKVRALTEGRVTAILNLHPFHTVHCRWAHEAFPDAKLYGTARHHAKFPDLPWQSARCEDAALADAFGDSFAFSVPAGVPLVCSNESVHFSSVLALHKASGTVHVDDTLMYLKKGFPLSLLPLTGKVGFHPTLAQALKPEKGAADAFAGWAEGLAREWGSAQRLATAHNAVLECGPGEFTRQVTAALDRVRPILAAHRLAHG